MGRAGGADRLPPPTRRRMTSTPLWNDFHSSVPGDRARRRGRPGPGAGRRHQRRVGRAARRLSVRVAAATERYLEVETHKPDNEVDKLLVAVCNAGTRGAAFGKQIAELEKRAGEIPVAIVRTTDFPKTGKAATQIAGMLKTARANGGRRRRRLAADAGVRGVPHAATRAGPTSPPGRRPPGRSVSSTRFKRSSS